jgi:site-specific DNA-methyltransferase (adenine-specific)
MPEALARDLIVSFGRPYDVVLDPLAGAGTTAKMAMLTGRRWLGFEVNGAYVALAHERLRKAERLMWAS